MAALSASTAADCSSHSLRSLSDWYDIPVRSHSVGESASASEKLARLPDCPAPLLWPWRARPATSVASQPCLHVVKRQREIMRRCARDDRVAICVDEHVSAVVDRPWIAAPRTPQDKPLPACHAPETVLSHLVPICAGRHARQCTRSDARSEGG